MFNLKHQLISWRIDQSNVKAGRMLVYQVFLFKLGLGPIQSWFEIV